MPFRRFGYSRVTSLVAASLLVSTGCDRSKAAVSRDTVAARAESATVPMTPVAAASGWNRLAGLALLVQGDSRDEAVVLLPAESDSVAATDIRALQDPRARVTLLGRGGQQMSAQFGTLPPTTDGECRVWPLSNIQGGGSGASWAVGFVGGQSVPLALDSVDALTSRDSMMLVAEVSRLASAVTSSTAPAFQGLRFTAHDIRRFEASSGVQAIVAHLIRRVNQEASPLEEQTLLIAERDSGTTSGPYHLVYADRTHGLEEELATPEVIAGVRIAGRPTLIVARDGDDGVAYVMLERIAPGQWRVRWTSAMTRCG